MKQKLLALSIAATLGLAAGVASAAPSVKVNGVGMINVIPYFSAQGSNATQISITNTDMVFGKAVKVRFRGAEWSDDIFDFTVFLSPGDVFTGAVTNNGSDVSNFSTSDNTCTLPTTVNQDFPTIRLHNTATGTLEGYIEVITMADIDPAGTLAPAGTSAATYSLYTATKHVNGVAPCKTAGSAAEKAITTLKQDNFHTPLAAPDATTGQDPDWMVAPTSGLTSWARVINVDSIKAFGVPATAIDFAATNKAYFRQANEAVAAGVNATALTSDRIFFNADVVATFPNEIVGIGANRGTPITQMYQFDLPDLSTDIEGAANAVTARDALTVALAKQAVATEYSTIAAVQAATDLVVAQPTRRYYYNYLPYTPAAGVTPVEGTDYSRTVGGATKYYIIKGDDAGDTTYAALDMKNRVGLANLDDVYLALGMQPVGYTPTPALFFDREEQYKAAVTDIVISPTPPATGYSLSLKGEASVLSFNRGAGATETGALGAKLTMNDITIVGGYQAGWVLLSTVETGGNALPLIGFGATNVAGAQNYGTTLPLRYFGAAGLIGQ